MLELEIRNVRVVAFRNMLKMSLGNENSAKVDSESMHSDSEEESEVKIHDRTLLTNFTNMHILDDAYNSKELDSWANSDSNGDGISHYVKFKSSYMSRDFKFIVGM